MAGTWGTGASSADLLSLVNLLASLLLLLLQAEARYRELTGLGLSVNLVLVGNKGKQYFSRRPQYNIISEYHSLMGLALLLGVY